MMFFYQAEDGIRELVRSRGLGDVYKRQVCRDFLSAQGKPTLHVLDLRYGKDIAERAHRPAPGWSDRHENRVRLKRAMLKELWGEEMPDQPSYESIRLLISPEVRQRMEERLILVEDVQQVIEHAERSGARFQNRQSGHYLAGHKPAAVTYWVEYSPLPASGQDQEPQFVVHNAYSHRMTAVSYTHLTLPTIYPV